MKALIVLGVLCVLVMLLAVCVPMPKPVPTPTPTVSLDDIDVPQIFPETYTWNPGVNLLVDRDSFWTDFVMPTDD